MVGMNFTHKHGCVQDRFRVSAEGKLMARARVDAESIWFDGHFPDQPILPGIAQLSLVTQVLHHHTGGRLRVTGYKRVRFRQMIQPADWMQISLEMSNAKNILFKITVNADVAAGGIVVVEPLTLKTKSGDH